MYIYVVYVLIHNTSTLADLTFLFMFPLTLSMLSYLSFVVCLELIHNLLGLVMCHVSCVVCIYESRGTSDVHETIFPLLYCNENTLITSIIMITFTNLSKQYLIDLLINNLISEYVDIPCPLW